MQPAADRSQLDPETRLRIEQAVLDIFSEREFHPRCLIEVARGANVLAADHLQVLRQQGSPPVQQPRYLDGQARHPHDRSLQGIEDYKERFRKVFWVSLDFFERNPKVMQLVMSSVYLNTWRKQETFRTPNCSAPHPRLARAAPKCGSTTRSTRRSCSTTSSASCFRLVQMYFHRGQRESLTKQRMCCSRCCGGRFPSRRDGVGEGSCSLSLINVIPAKAGIQASVNVALG